MAHPGAGDPLAPFVEGVWAFEGRMTLLRERHLPSGTLDLVVQLGARYRPVQGDGVGSPFPRSSLGGVHLEPDVIQAPDARNGVVGARLRPLGAWRLLAGRASLAELVGRTEDLSALLPPGDPPLAALEDACLAAPEPCARVRSAEGWLRRRILDGPAVDPGVTLVEGRTRKLHGRIQVGALAREAGGSRTRLTAAFVEAVGVTPRRYASLLRFRAAVEAIRTGDATLSAVSHATGYADQAHMTRDFRTFGETTPAAYRRALRFPESASLPEGG